MRHFLVSTLLLSTLGTNALADNNNTYLAIIDAGSSGSRIHVFEVNPTNKNQAPIVDELTVDNNKVKPGLSAYLNNPSAAGQSIQPLLESAKTVLQANHAQPKNTHLYVMATAGMRLIPTAEQKPIYDSVKATLEASNLGEAAQPTTIDGTNEGEFGWLAINYDAQNHRFPAPGQTQGALDLGGASTQITYEAAPMTVRQSQSADFKSLSLGGKTYSLFVHSFLGFGQDQARMSMLPFYHHDFSACYPKDYNDAEQPLLGKSDGFNWNQCATEINAYLKANHVNTIVPDSAAAARFTAFSGYAFTMQFFNADTPEQLRANAQADCSQDWEAFKAAHSGVDEKFLANYCLNATYISNLLETGYHATPAKTLTIDADASDWTLGAALAISAGDYR